MDISKILKDTPRALAIISLEDLKKFFSELVIEEREKVIEEIEQVYYTSDEVKRMLKISSTMIVSLFWYRYITLWYRS